MSTKQISRISIYQSSKFFAAGTFILVLIAEILCAIMVLLSGLPLAGDFVGLLVGFVAGLVLAPLAAFVAHAIMFWFYNVVASMVGGIEVSCKEKE